MSRRDKTPGAAIRHLGRSGLAVAAWTALALALAPATVGGDGVGYLQQIDGASLSPGHIAYLPLARAVAALWPADSTLLELVLPLRLLSLLCTLGALLLLGRALLRDHGERAALLGVALLAGSHAVLRASHEVEVYGVALLVASALLASVLSYRREPTRTRLLLVGLLAGLAPLFHLTLALLSASCVVACAVATPSGRRLRALLGGGAVAAALLLPLLALACATAGAQDVGNALAWLLSSDHGLPYPLRPTTPLVALWGMAKSLVYAPYLYEAPLWRVALQSAAGGALLITWSSLAWRRRGVGALWALSARELLLLAAPLSLFGVLFYPSDTERWLFVLPLIAAALAPRLADVPAAVWLAAAALLFNVAFLAPAALDDGDMRRAERTEALLRPADLLISPGHGWAELVGLGLSRATKKPAKFALTYYVGAKGRARAAALLHERAAATLRGGGRVFVARLRDGSDRRGFKELERLGIGHAAWRGLFARYGQRERGALVQLLAP